MVNPLFLWPFSIANCKRSPKKTVGLPSVQCSFHGLSPQFLDKSLHIETVADVSDFGWNCYAGGTHVNMQSYTYVYIYNIIMYIYNMWIYVDKLRDFTNLIQGKLMVILLEKNTSVARCRSEVIKIYPYTIDPTLGSGTSSYMLYYI